MISINLHTSRIQYSLPYIQLCGVIIVPLVHILHRTSCSVWLSMMSLSAAGTFKCHFSVNTSILTHCIIEHFCLEGSWKIPKHLYTTYMEVYYACNTDYGFVMQSSLSPPVNIILCWVQG